VPSDECTKSFQAVHHRGCQHREKEANTNSEHSYDNPFDATLREQEAKVELDRMPRTGATNKDIFSAPGRITRACKSLMKEEATSITLPSWAEKSLLSIPKISIIPKNQPSRS
jgi:hypothetical protein